jgi:S1-C subfamily serine protease
MSEIGTIHRAATIHTDVVDGIGSSGDPLFDANGRFLGLLAGSSITGSNFAITVDEIRKFVFSSIRSKPSDFSPIAQSPSENIRVISEESDSSQQFTD